MTSAALAVRQDELEREAQLDRLREVCERKNITILIETNDSKITYRKSINCLKVGANVSQDALLKCLGRLSLTDLD